MRQVAPPLLSLHKSKSESGYTQGRSNRRWTALMAMANRPRVLVADDERLIADTLAMILTRDGYDTSAVYSGTDAIGKARTWKPDLLVSEVSMPEVDGISAALAILTLLPKCKILLFSSDVRHADRIRGDGFLGDKVEFIQKPIRPAVLLNRIRHLNVA